MSESPTDTQDTPHEPTDLWTDIEDDVRSLFGEDVEVTVREYSDHLDVRIMPDDAVASLEAEHDGLNCVPYNAFQMTVRPEE